MRNDACPRERGGRSAKTILIIVSAVLAAAVIGLVLWHTVFTCSVSFICGSAETERAPVSQKVHWNQKAQCPAAPIRTGLHFMGWFTDPTLQQPYDFREKVHRDLTLYAGWVSDDAPDAIPTQKETDQFLQAIDLVKQAAGPLLDSDGCAADAQAASAAADAAETQIRQLQEDGVISFYERTDQAVYAELPSGFSFFFAASTADESATGSERIVAVMPFLNAQDATYEIGDEFGPAARNAALAVLNSGLPYEAADEYTADTVTRDALKQIDPNTSLLLWSGHGNYFSTTGSVLVTGEEIKILPHQDVQELVSNGRCTACVQNNRTYYAITSKFVKDYLKLNHALVYLEACQSGRTDTLAAAFQEVGAETVFYHQGEENVKNWYGDAMMTMILRYMNGTGPVVENNVITERTDEEMHTAEQALELAETWMRAYARDTFSLDYEGKSFDRSLAVNGDDPFFDCSVGVYGEEQYSFSTSVSVTLTSPNGSVDVGKVDLKLDQLPPRRYSPASGQERFYALEAGAHTLDLYLDGTVIKSIQVDAKLHRCTPVTLDLTMTSVEGRVLNSETREPIADAEVLCSVAGNDYSAKTDAQGSFSVVNVPSGLCGVSVRAEGYLSQSDQTVTIPEGGDRLDIGELLMDPYEAIRSAADLEKLRERPDGRFRLLQDLDLSGIADWQPIGTDQQPFTGELDGGGHTISGLTIQHETSDSYYAGLFGAVRGGEIHRLNVSGSVNLAVNGSGEAFALAGGIVGDLRSGRVERCSFSGTVRSETRVEGFSRAGGIAGCATAESTISDCWVQARVSSRADSYNTMAAGIAAWLDHSEIHRCGVQGSVIAEKTGCRLYAGGISASGDHGVISNCFVLLDTLDARLVFSRSDAVSFTAKTKGCCVSEEMQGDYCVFYQLLHHFSYHRLSAADAHSESIYRRHGWDFDTVWFMTPQGVPALRP